MLLICGRYLTKLDGEGSSVLRLSSHSFGEVTERLPSCVCVLRHPALEHFHRSNPLRNLSNQPNHYSYATRSSNRVRSATRPRSVSFHPRTESQFSVIRASEAASSKAASSPGASSPVCSKSSTSRFRKCGELARTRTASSVNRSRPPSCRSVSRATSGTLRPRATNRTAWSRRKLRASGHASIARAKRCWSYRSKPRSAGVRELLMNPA